MADSPPLQNMKENIRIISMARITMEIINCVFIILSIKNGISRCILQIHLCHGYVHG